MAAARVGTAGTAQVLTGYTFTNSSSSGINGSMTNQGTKTYTINPGRSQTIPEGYHSGSGTVTANANQNSGTYTFASGNGATVDMGVNNTYRYVNASNVYQKGLDEGSEEICVSAYLYNNASSAALQITNTNHGIKRVGMRAINGKCYWNGTRITSESIFDTSSMDSFTASAGAGYSCWVDLYNY